MFVNGIERLSAYWVGLGLVLLGFVLGYAYHLDARFGLIFFDWAELWSGRLSLVFFLVVMAYATLRPGFAQIEGYYPVKYQLFLASALLFCAYWVIMALKFFVVGMELFPVRLAGGGLALLLSVGMPVAMGRATWTGRGLMAWQSGMLFWVWVVWMFGHANFIGSAGTDASGLIVYWVSFFALVVLIFWRSVYVLLQWMEEMKQRPSK